MSKGICCRSCHTELRDEDILIVDFMYTLYHRFCYHQPASLIETIGTFEAIKVKYPFFNERPLQEIIAEFWPDNIEDEEDEY